LGFRQSAPAHWREPDGIMSFFVTLSDNGTVAPISDERLVEDLHARRPAALSRRRGRPTRPGA
jgi:hypothetical protein